MCNTPSTQLTTPPRPSERGQGGETAPCESGGEVVEAKPYQWQTASVDRYDILKGYARHNRLVMTDAERWLWKQLRNVPEYKFRRQHPIGDYIVDFVCLKLRLIIEVDGGYHNTAEQQHEDAIRSAVLQKQGFDILRFTNEEVLFDTETTLQNIYQYIQHRKPLFL